MKRRHGLLGISVIALVIILLGAQKASTPAPAVWPTAGQSLANLWSQPSESQINISNAVNLVPQWVFSTLNDVSATPTVSASAVYVPDWSGHLYSIDRSTGRPLWMHQISEYDNVAGSVTRVSPAIYKDELIIGDSQTSHLGVNLIAVDQATGNLRWITQVDPHPAAIITGSPVVVGNTVYEGISSSEESLANQVGYPCCTFRGSIVALNADTGALLWQTFDMPDNGGQPGGYSGGAIWQPPAIDTARGLLYVGTGNNYSAPDAAEACEAEAQANQTSDANCTAADDYFDTVLALDLQTGAIRWAKKLYGYDVWTQACKNPRAGVTCPSPLGPDYDLGGSGPNLIGNIVGIGQKSGIYWALNADTGDLVWSTVVGPGGTLGGIQWGTASDGSRIFVPITNFSAKSYMLQPSGKTITWGSWSALDVTTGKILWQTADPIAGTMDMSAMSVANGVVYAGSFDKSGHMHALDAATGKVLWSFGSGGAVIGAPSIADGHLYWGSGYKKVASGTGNNKVYSFAVRTASSSPVILVSTPGNGGSYSSPVQYTASAYAPSCSNGIAAIRIYTAPNQSAFTADASSINTTVALSPGIYNTVVQAWDKCGHVGKSYVSIAVH
jgi:polyvinyl alcohol dehydrogenase (cytochrome)